MQFMPGKREKQDSDEPKIIAALRAENAELRENFEAERKVRWRLEEERSRLAFDLKTLSEQRLSELTRDIERVEKNREELDAIRRELMDFKELYRKWWKVILRLTVSFVLLEIITIASSRVIPKGNSWLVLQLAVNLFFAPYLIVRLVFSPFYSCNNHMYHKGPSMYSRLVRISMPLGLALTALLVALAQSVSDGATRTALFNSAFVVFVSTAIMAVSNATSLESREN
jgi:hypothetical protein